MISRASLYATAALLLSIALPTFGQEPPLPPPPPGAHPGGPPPGPHQRPDMMLSPEQAEEAWNLEANHVARKLELSPDLSTKLAAAYVQARRDHGMAMRDALGGPRGGGPRGGDRQDGAPDAERVREIERMRREKIDEARASLQKSISAFLNESQTTEAVRRLGGFSRQWDQMALTLKKFNLGDQQSAAMELAHEYTIEAEQMLQDGPTGSLRDQLKARRDVLDTAVGKYLTAAQLEQWKTETTMQRRMPGERRGPGGPPGPPPPQP